MGLSFGVFFREFTKLNNFTGETMLSYMYVHYIMLGTMFFIILLVLEKNFSFVDSKMKKVLISYHIGLNLMQLFFLIRGIIQVLNIDISKAIDSSISGFAGLAHIIIGVSFVMIINSVRKKKKLDTLCIFFCKALLN